MEDLVHRKTNYFTTLTWPERRSTSQHLHGRFGAQKDKVLHNTSMEDLVHTKTHKDRVFHTTYKLHVEFGTQKKQKRSEHLHGGFGIGSNTNRCSICTGRRRQNYCYKYFGLTFLSCNQSNQKCTKWD